MHSGRFVCVDDVEGDLKYLIELLGFFHKYGLLFYTKFLSLVKFWGMHYLYDL